MSYRVLKNTGSTLIENLIVVALVFVLIGIFGARMGVYVQEARESALNNQLTNIKNSLELYKALKGGYPSDLRQLNKPLISLNEDSFYGRKFLEHQTLDTEGYPIDPFGNRYIYDNETGKVGRRKDEE